MRWVTHPERVRAVAIAARTKADKTLVQWYESSIGSPYSTEQGPINPWRIQMSLLSTILEKLGIGKHAASPAEAAPATPSAGTSPAAPQTTAITPTAAISEVDVASKLEALASQQGSS